MFSPRPGWLLVFVEVERVVEVLNGESRRASVGSGGDRGSVRSASVEVAQVAVKSHTTESCWRV